MPRPTRLARRTLLKGFSGGVGAAVGLPLLEAMVGSRAHAQAAAPAKLFGIFWWANGVRAERWVPAATGANWALTEELQPLAPVKSLISVVSGYEVKDSRFGHHCATAGMLSGFPCIDQATMPGGANERSTFSAPSMDVVAARAWAGKTRIKSLELSCLKNGYDEGTTYEQLSHNGPNDVNPAELSPAAVFDRLFAVQDPGSQVRLARASILDVLKQDTVALKAKLGAADKVRMDQHLENIRTLERGLQAAPQACTVPSRPANLTPTGANLVARFKAMSDLIAVALACDLTRVFSLRLTPPADNTVLTLPGISSGMHDLTHNEGGAQPNVHAHVVFAMQQLAYLVGRLAATVDATGASLTDRLAMLCTTDCQLGQTHDNTNFPVLLAGKASGALKAGVHQRSTTNESSTKILITLLQALEMPVAQFGAGPLQASGAIANLLA
jgi:Protein of unknown function (DUF1552)